jgi:uncharacterized protein YukE
MAGGYDVDVPTLRAGARHLEDDADAVAGTGAGAERAAADAAAGAGAAVLQAALGRLADAAWTRCTGLSEALSSAGTTLSGNADRYRQDDDDARRALDATTFEPLL